MYESSRWCPFLFCCLWSGERRKVEREADTQRDITEAWLSGRSTWEWSRERDISSSQFSFQRFNVIFLQGCFWLSSTGQTALPHIISHPISPLDISLFSCRSSPFQPNFLIALLSTPLSPTKSFQIHLTLSLLPPNGSQNPTLCPLCYWNSL